MGILLCRNIEVVIDNTDENYRAPESLYRTVMLGKKANNQRGADNAYQQLLQDFPENAWTQKAIEASGAKP